MSETSDLKQAALRRMAEVWQVDADRVIWRANGFEWWPGSFKVSVMCRRTTDDSDGEDGPAWRLVVRTDFLKDVPIDSEKVRTKIAEFAAESPMYAVVYFPREFAEKHPSLWLQSTVYLRPENAGWLPSFLARSTLLQPIDAQRKAWELAASLGATPDVSTPRPGTPTDHHDDMLDVADAIYVPKGREPNLWIGSSEFEEFASRFGDTDQCFGIGEKTGLTLEMPFGNSTSLIRLATNSPHPYLGSALRTFLLLPYVRTTSELENECAWLNLFEATKWTGFPQLGSWSPMRHGHHWYSGNVFFLPNAFYTERIAMNVALWQLERAEWAKKTLFPDLRDRALKETLKERYGKLAAPD